MFDLSKLSPDQLKKHLAASYERNKEAYHQADCMAAWLYAQNLAFIDKVEAEDRAEPDCDT